MSTEELHPSEKSRIKPEVAATPTYQLKAFISYKHKADDVLAKALERSLEQFSKKWYQLRAFDVFRDVSSLGANPGLKRTLQASLDSTEFYILLASPESADSVWVRDELSALARRSRLREASYRSDFRPNRLGQCRQRLRLGPHHCFKSRRRPGKNQGGATLGRLFLGPRARRVDHSP